jgi:HK97 family phage major capsid protein
MANLFEMRQQQQHALDKADNILKAAEASGRPLTKAEEMDVDTNMLVVKTLGPQIETIMRSNSLVKVMKNGRLLPANLNQSHPRGEREGTLKQLSADYSDAFGTYISTKGTQIDAALYEGSDGSGGFAVPSFVDGQIVPLAPQEFAVRRLATVIPTGADIKIPRKTAFGVAAGKAETGTSSNYFTSSTPTIDQFTLSAFMGGIQEPCSWEIVQDVNTFQAFVVDDGLLAMQTREEDLYVNGSGSGEAEGLIGNVGAGATQALSLAGTLDLVGTLNAMYHPGASFLMQRATSIALRKLQTAANLFNPAWTRVGTQDYLHGYPVEYSQAMPANSGSNTPILFGDFKRGYVIGDRGGSGINVKILDQPRALEGVLVMLFYRRTDGRVRRSEAIQGYTL